MAASVVCSALVVLGVTLVHSTGAQESPEEKLSCIHMRGGRASQECVVNLFKEHGLNMAIENALPLPEGAAERVRVLAAGCLAFKAFRKAPEYGCVPAQSIREAYDCIYTHEEKKEELLNAFNVRSQEEYLQFADQIEGCQGSWTANRKNNRHSNYSNFRRGDRSATNHTRVMRAVEEAASHNVNKTA